MASSMSIFSRRLITTPSFLLSTTKPSPPLLSMHFSTTSKEDSDFDDLGLGPELNLEDSSSSSSSSSRNNTNEQRPTFQRPLENGLDTGVYKAILVGQVGQLPFQKRLKSGRPVTLFSLGTGGIRNNRRPLDNEEPREYADRCSVQWHRVCVYPERLGALALNHIKPGSTMYLEGNLETKIFNDPISGLVRRIREIAIRRDGRLVFLSKDGDTGESNRADMKGVGYF
ncbi:hypothetical protein IFM89_020083 [Coptis chinensis]|uniref:Single-stranded DNA-binding protein n=1 Tax=Coptis chinensis TaxID=261450 RepID=A0A835HFS3_9MAGN|nr:hypothetical protein IFM89_020083 [Coptis chinensis]